MTRSGMAATGSSSPRVSLTRDDGKFMPWEAYRMADTRMAQLDLQGTPIQDPKVHFICTSFKWPHGHRLHRHTEVCRPISPEAATE